MRTTTPAAPAPAPADRPTCSPWPAPTPGTPGHADPASSRRRPPGNRAPRARRGERDRQPSGSDDSPTPASPRRTRRHSGRRPRARSASPARRAASTPRRDRRGHAATSRSGRENSAAPRADTPWPGTRRPTSHRGVSTTDCGPVPSPARDARKSAPQSPAPRRAESGAACSRCDPRRESRASLPSAHRRRRRQSCKPDGRWRGGSPGRR